MVLLAGLRPPSRIACMRLRHTWLTFVWVPSCLPYPEQFVLYGRVQPSRHEILEFDTDRTAFS